jgi:hypothetical protein
MRHADVLQFAFQKMNAGGDFQLMILDEDLVPFRSWDPKLEIGEKMIGFYVGQERSNNGSIFTYPWPGFFYVDMSLSRSNELVSWDTFVNNEIRLDTGGAMLNWLNVKNDSNRNIEF